MARPKGAKGDDGMGPHMRRWGGGEPMALEEDATACRWPAQALNATYWCASVFARLFQREACRHSYR